MPFLTLNYKRIHYTDHPSTHPSGHTHATILLHHGLGSSQNFYTALIPLLTSTGLRAIAYDTTGSARSPYTQIEQTIPSLAADALALLDALSVPSALVAGHSMGALVASHLAATSSRITAAILIGPVYPSPALADVFAKRIDTVNAHGMDPLADTIPTAATGANSSPLARAFVRELLLAQDPAGYASSCRVIAGAARPAWETIKVPVLVVAGAEDKSAPLEKCRQIFEEVGAGTKRIEVLEGVGHWHCVEAPEVVGGKIVGFVEEVLGRQ